jgi:hypothetical protein
MGLEGALSVIAHLHAAADKGRQDTEAHFIGRGIAEGAVNALSAVNVKMLGESPS